MVSMNDLIHSSISLSFLNSLPGTSSSLRNSSNADWAKISRVSFKHSTRSGRSFGWDRYLGSISGCSLNINVNSSFERSWPWIIGSNFYMTSRFSSQCSNMSLKSLFSKFPTPVIKILAWDEMELNVWMIEFFSRFGSDKSSCVKMIRRAGASSSKKPLRSN